ncbi:MAG: phosphate regulon transcriptional regulator PhoB [Gammaproteobacteria bacterium]|nr:phosphate regulon transcriptional regulator PhoB [Gammaproteobacteria bacterium]
MAGKNILIVEDEAAIREMVRFALGKSGFNFIEASDADEAQALMADQLPDLILLDWMLPGISGIELARRLKRDDYTRGVPIIMLTARSEEDDRVGGLEAGADDYVTKPFSPRELVARIKAVLRRAQPEGEGEVLSTEGLQLDTISHRVTVDGNTIDMGPTEFRLLRHFMSHTERVFSRGQLLDAVWGRNSFVEERTVDVHILRLRKVLGQYGRDNLIQTVRGAGYRFSAQ